MDSMLVILVPLESPFHALFKNHFLPDIASFKLQVSPHSRLPHISYTWWCKWQ